MPYGGALVIVQGREDGSRSPGRRRQDSWPGDWAATCSDAVVTDRVREVLRLIESESPASIRDVAHRLDLSESHLMHIFKKDTGRSLGQVITERRIRTAADLLAHSRLSVKAVAYTLGYKHSSSFIRAFERYFGRAPRLFRQDIEHRKS